MRRRSPRHPCPLRAASRPLEALGRCALVASLLALGACGPATPDGAVSPESAGETSAIASGMAPPAKGARALPEAPERAALLAPEAEVRVTRLGVDRGLSQSTVTAILQDRHGFVWIGTEGGLDRYDGAGVVSYRHEPGNPGSLSSSFVNALAQTSDGALWVGTHGAGLNRLDPASGVARRFRHDSTAAATLSADRVGALLVDRRGRLWAGTGRGVDRVDLETGAVRRVAALDEVTDLAEDPASGDLWAATHEGAVRLDPETGRERQRLSADALGSPLAEAVWADADGTLWVGTESGLARVDAASGAVRRLAGPGLGPDGARVQDVMRDARGTLWVATRGGLARLDPAAEGQSPEAPPSEASGGAWRVLVASQADPYSLPTSNTRTLAEDRAGLVWVGTWAGGVGIVRRTPFRRFAAESGRAGALSSSDVMGMAQAPDGALWVGTYDGGLNRLDLATGRATQDPAWPAALRREAVRAVAFTPDGALWATGDARGLWRRDPETERWAQIPFERGAGVERVLHVATAPDGSVWAATYGAGPCVAAPQATELRCPARDWTGSRALRSDLAYAVFPERGGRLWVSLWGSGADLVDPARGRAASVENRPSDPTSLSDNNVTSFYRDATGDLWLTTYGGGLNKLLSLDGDGTFQRVTERDGLPNGTAYRILPDARGHFWVSTNRGLARYDPGADAVDAFGVDDGLPANEFNGYSAASLADGRLAFGGIGGLAVFDPERVGADAPAPAVAVTAVRVLGREVDYPATSEPPALALSHRQSAVAFDVAALDFAAPEDNRYAYWLEGQEETWGPPSRRRTAAYTNLVPGRYTFRVRASGAAGVWNEAGLAVPIVVRPAWWQTWPFRIGAGLALLAFGVAGVREASQRRLRREVQRLETERALQAERERISRDLHDHVGAQLSGLIASAELARLQRRRGGASGAAAEPPTPPHPTSRIPPAPPEADPLGRIEGEARETMRQLRETVWALHHEAVTLGAFADRLRADLGARLRGHADAPQATVTLHGDPAHVLSPLQALHLYRIAREAATNAIKHARASRLEVTLGLQPRTAADPGAVTVEVRDDGTFRVPGGAPEASGAPPGTAAEGGLGASGFGMGSMRARADALGGTFALETERGTAVRVRVPLAAPSQRGIASPEQGSERHGGARYS